MHFSHRKKISVFRRKPVCYVMAMKCKGSPFSGLNLIHLSILIVYVLCQKDRHTKDYHFSFIFFLKSHEVNPGASSLFQLVRCAMKHSVPTVCITIKTHICNLSVFNHQTGDFEQTLTTGKSDLTNEQWKIWTFV